MNRFPKILPDLVVCLLALVSCTTKLSGPDTGEAASLIKKQILENGDMPGGNRIDIHQFNVLKMEGGSTPNSTTVSFQIDYTRYPTSGLAPEYQTEEPMRQTEEHKAVLTNEKGQWSVTDLSLR